MNTFNAEDMSIEAQSTETLVQNLQDYLNNESLGYGDTDEAITYGESVIIAICEELRTREGDFEELIEAAMFEAFDVEDDSRVRFYIDDVADL
jgi:hypothetical protein